MEGVATGSGLSKGSAAGFSAEAVVFVDVVCLPVRLGLVVWADKFSAVRETIAATLRKARIKVDLLIVVQDCIRERVRFESSDSGFSNRQLFGCRVSERGSLMSDHCVRYALACRDAKYSDPWYR